ncbi:TolC family protein, partial [Acinetobacter baumannii]
FGAAHAANLTDINALITQAVQTHPLVGAAIADEQATRESITAAKLNLYPAPAISSGYDQDKGLISRANVRQALWTGGKLTANVNQAIYDDKAATA